MISPLNQAQQHARACGRCHSRTPLRPIAHTAAVRYKAMRAPVRGAGINAMQAVKTNCKSVAQILPQEDDQAPIVSSSSHQAQHWPVVVELLASHTSLLAFAVLMLYLAPTDPAAADSLHQHPVSLFDVAEGEEGILSNMVKYARYFVTVLLGTGYVMVQPLVAAFKKPVTAVVAIVGVVGGAYLLKFTLDAMLGIQEPFSYETGSIVPYS